MGGKGNFELAKNVVGTLDQLGALPDELMAPAGERIVDGPGDGEDLAARFAGEPGRDQRAGSLRRFDHQGAVRQGRR